MKLCANCGNYQSDAAVRCADCGAEMIGEFEHDPVLPCVVCGAPDHEGYWDHDGERLLSVDCPNAHRPDIVEKVRRIKEADRVRLGR